MRKIITFHLILMLLAGLSACATRSKEQVFDATLRSYERVVRWGDITRVNQFRKDPVVFSDSDKKRLKSIKITGYQARQVTAVSNDVITVDVRINYYNEQYARQKSLDDLQRWEYDSESNLWFISSPLPDFLN